ncbi:MAG: transcription elongation factor Elf1 [Alphaproteobacteria bacterium]|jgi:transcription elongation factor Elf1
MESLKFTCKKCDKSGNHLLDWSEKFKKFNCSNCGTAYETGNTLHTYIQCENTQYKRKSRWFAFFMGLGMLAFILIVVFYR